MHKFLLRHNLIWIIFILLFLPLVLALTTRLSKTQLSKHLTAQFKLTGFTDQSTKPPLDLNHFNSHDIQKSYEKMITNKLPLRSFLIRINNQIYYSVFKKSYSQNSQIIIGKSNQLFELSYILAHCSQPQNLYQLQEWANKIKIMSDFFEKKGKTLIYFISPSKADFLPEAIPDRFHCNKNSENSRVKIMEKLLNERHIHYINGHDLIVSSSVQYGIPMFPKGGTHWNNLGVSLAANILIKKINQVGKVHVNSLSFEYKLTHKPKNSDQDLLKLLNLFRPDFNYTVPKLNFQTQNLHPSVTAAFIGGSFMTQLIDILMDNKLFSKITYYFYTHEKVNFEVNKKPVYHLDIDFPSAKNLAEVFSSDIVILEENASILPSNHGKLFFNSIEKMTLPNTLENLSLS